MNQISQGKIHLRKIINGVAHMVVDVTMVEEDLKATKEEEDYFLNSVKNLDTLYQPI